MLPLDRGVVQLVERRVRREQSNKRKRSTITAKDYCMLPLDRGVVQLVERMHGVHEVVGSSPAAPTNRIIKSPSREGLYSTMPKEYYPSYRVENTEENGRSTMLYCLELPLSLSNQTTVFLPSVCRSLRET